MSYWSIQLPIMVRTIINDLGETPTYSDGRLNQAIVVAASYVPRDANLEITYVIDIINETITPDPCAPTTSDTLFTGLVALKTACMLDQSTFRTKAVNEGIRTALGSANLSVAGNLAGYKTILEMGPCKTYQELVQNWNIGNATAVQAILSPFVGNNFDATFLSRAINSPMRNDTYGNIAY